jgi:uncharacterized delta-60 repeat protein
MRRARKQSSPPAIFEILEERRLLSGSDTTFNWTAIIQDVWQHLFPTSAADKADNGGEDNGDEAGNAESDGKDRPDDKDKPEKGKGHGHGPPLDAAPTAEISVGDVTSLGSGAHTVQITYSDDKKIRAKSIDVHDITVTGAGNQTLDVTRVSISPDKDNNQVIATYFVSAPGGKWDAGDYGTFDVTINSNQVLDSKNQPVTGVSKSFQVSIVAAVDNAGPVGSISVGDVTSAGGGTAKVVVTYTDDVALNLNSIGPADLTITGPGGARTIRTVDVDSNADGTRAMATYVFGAPGGSWDSADNGTYKVSLNENQVRDTSNKGATAPLASFTVNIAKPDPVDPGFGSSPGTGGSVSTSFVAEAVVSQPDGKILVAGRQGNLAGGASQAVLQRYNADGSLDTTFGSKGHVVSAVGNNDAYYAIALDATGRIYVAGTRGGNMLVSRYDSAGKLDTSYGKSGVGTSDFGTSSDSAYALGLADDGSVVLAGGPGGNFAMARFLASGAVDPNFGQGGQQMFDLGSDNDTPGAVAYQENKVEIVGTSGGKVPVVRIRDDGEADETFSGDGLLLLDSVAARTDANFADRSTAAAVQPDGKLLLANRSSDGDFAIARLNSNGALDTSFGNSGVKTVDFGGDDDADAIIVQDTGEILVIGTTNSGGSASTAVAALSTSGELISDFGTDGKLTLAADLSSSARELHLGDLVLRAFGTKQADGRIVIGTSDRSSGTVGGSTGAGGSSSDTSSRLTRLNVPGTRAQPQGEQLGTFGVANGKRTTLTATDGDGTKIVFSASRGSGTVYVSGGKYNVMLSDGAGGASAVIKTSGGDGHAKLGDVVVSGTLRSLSAKNADLSGTLFSSGSIGNLALGDLTGNVVAAGAVGRVSLRGMKGARVMSGAGLGSDGKLGGTASDADSFAAGSIASVRVAGPVEASTISAGLDPVDGVFNNDDDTVIGGEQSLIRSVVARSADATSRFIAGKIVSLKLPASVKLAEDERVDIVAPA